MSPAAEVTVSRAFWASWSVMSSPRPDADAARQSARQQQHSTEPGCRMMRLCLLRAGPLVRGRLLSAASRGVQEEWLVQSAPLLCRSADAWFESSPLLSQLVLLKFFVGGLVPICIALQGTCQEAATSQDYAHHE